MTDQPKADRISAKKLWRNILDAFELKKGLLYTFKELTLRPGTALKEYLEGDRKLINPVKYVLLVAAIAFFYSYIMGKLNPESIGSGEAEIEVQIHTYLNYTVPPLFFAFVLFLFFKKREYNFYEYLVVTMFLWSHIMIISLLIEGFLGFILKDLFDFIFPTLIIAYLTWGIRSLMKTSLIKALITTIIALILGGISVKALNSIVYFVMYNTETVIGIYTEQHVMNEQPNNLFVDSVIMFSPGWNAGIKEGDTLLKVNNEKTSMDRFTRQIQNHVPGDTVLVTVQRNGKELDFNVILTHRDSLYKD